MKYLDDTDWEALVGDLTEQERIILAFFVQNMTNAHWDISPYLANLAWDYRDKIKPNSVEQRDLSNLVAKIRAVSDKLNKED